MRSTLLAFAFALVAVLTSAAQTNSFLITNVTIVDGSGTRPYTANVRISGGRISGIGKLRPKKGETTIDAAGLALAPGFIDIHNHSESGLLREGTAANQVSQGITTIIVGPDGGSPESVGAYLSSLQGKTAVNVGSFIGHGTLRRLVMKGDLKRMAAESEIVDMQALVETAMREGAFGLSSGLEYDAGFSASTEELIELARVAGRHGGIYMTHMRDEEEGVMDAIREAMRIGLEAAVPLHISHIKMGNKSVWNRSGEAIAMINERRLAGQDITADAYPYTAWASTITVLVPNRKHDDPAEVAKGIAALGGADKVLITSCDAFPEFEGKTLEQAAVLRKLSPAETYIEIVKNGGAGIIGYGMNETDVKNFYRTPWVMVASDGGIGSRHPRGTGTFTRVLGKFVREEKLLSLATAVQKMSAMPAQRLGLSDRGRIAKGMQADLVLFDPETVTDLASFTEPQKLSSGIKRTYVNGVLVWDGDKITGELPGEVLRNRRSQPARAAR